MGCGCNQIGGRKTRRRGRRKRRTHRRRIHKQRTKRHRLHYYKKRRTRHRRGGLGVQVIGGSKEGLILLGGNCKTPSLAISDYPPGLSKFTNRDKEQWKKIKRKYKRHRKH